MATKRKVSQKNTRGEKRAEKPVTRIREAAERAGIAQPGELEGLRAIAKAAEAIFEHHGEDPFADVALNALICAKQDIEDLAWFAQLLRMTESGMTTKDPELAYRRVILRIELAVMIANHQYDIAHAAEAVAS